MNRSDTRWKKTTRKWASVSGQKKKVWHWLISDSTDWLVTGPPYAKAWATGNGAKKISFVFTLNGGNQSLQKSKFFLMMSFSHLHLLALVVIGPLKDLAWPGAWPTFLPGPYVGVVRKSRHARRRWSQTRRWQFIASISRGTAILSCRYGPHEKSWIFGLGSLDLNPGQVLTAECGETPGRAQTFISDQSKEVSRDRERRRKLHRCIQTAIDSARRDWSSARRDWRLFFRTFQPSFVISCPISTNEPSLESLKSQQNDGAIFAPMSPRKRTIAPFLRRVLTLLAQFPRIRTCSGQINLYRGEIAVLGPFRAVPARGYPWGRHLNCGRVGSASAAIARDRGWPHEGARQRPTWPPGRTTRSGRAGRRPGFVLELHGLTDHLMIWSCLGRRKTRCSLCRANVRIPLPTTPRGLVEALSPIISAISRWNGPSGILSLPVCPLSSSTPLKLDRRDFHLLSTVVPVISNPWRTISSTISDIALTRDTFFLLILSKNPNSPSFPFMRLKKKLVSSFDHWWFDLFRFEEPLEPTEPTESAILERASTLFGSRQAPRGKSSSQKFNIIHMPGYEFVALKWILWRVKFNVRMHCDRPYSQNSWNSTINERPYWLITWFEVSAGSLQIPDVLREVSGVRVLLVPKAGLTIVKSRFDRCL